VDDVEELRHEIAHLHAVAAMNTDKRVTEHIGVMIRDLEQRIGRVEMHEE
jgi:hypothetical protein